MRRACTEEPLRSRMLLSRAHMLLGGMPESGTPYGAAADGLPTDSDTAPLEAGIAMPAGVLSLTELDAFGSPISGGEFARELDLRNAAVKSGRAIGSLIVKREFFASHGELGNLCIRLSASKPITWQLRLSEIPADPDAVYRADSAAGTLSAEGIASGCRFVTALHIESTDGKIQADVDSLTVSGAKTLTAYLAVSVSDAARTDSIFPAFQCGSYEAAFTEHKKAYSELFGVCDINIAASEAERRESSALTLDALLSGYRAGRYRSLVPMLYFNLGRNLLISSAGVLPLPTQKAVERTEAARRAAAVRLSAMRHLGTRRVDPYRARRSYQSAAGTAGGVEHRQGKRITLRRIHRRPRMDRRRSSPCDRRLTHRRRMRAERTGTPGMQCNKRITSSRSIGL